MAKIHGDFGDMTRYDVTVPKPDAPEGKIRLYCQDCDAAIQSWPQRVVNLADINRVAAEHEITEEDGVPPQTRFGD